MAQLTDEELKSAVEDLIRSEIFLRDVPYSMQDGLQELDPDSVDDASKAIVKFFKEQYVVDKYGKDTSQVVLSDSSVVDVIKKNSSTTTSSI